MKLNKGIVTAMALVSFLAMVVALTGCAGNGSHPNGDGSSTPELNWITKPGLLTAERHYQAGTFLTGYTVYNYIEVTGGSGEVELDVELEGKAGKSVTFLAEKGKSYKVALLVNCSGYIPVGYRPFDEHVFIFNSPSADSSDEQRVSGYFSWDDLSLQKLEVLPWEYTSPEPSTLNVRVYPAGSGSISDHLGKLAYQSENDNGEIAKYVGTYDYGTEVILTATPNEGYLFDHWGGTENELPAHLPLGIIDGNAESSIIVMRMNLNIYITAYFSEIGGT